VHLAPSRRAALRRKLLAWYDAGHRDLPWRGPQHGADPYRVWLAEVMLQQTQVATAAPYYRRFLERFPTLSALAQAREHEVLELWSGLGYYARGRNLHAAARAALERHGGLPGTVAALRALPGFGPYTAGAVASIAFAVPAAAVDGNVSRVLQRLCGLPGTASDAAVRAAVRARAEELVPAVRPGDHNQALMELGATVCTPAAPSCRRCPIAPHCQALASGRTGEIPAPRRRPARRRLELACAVVRREWRWLLARRPARGLFGGLWAPPAAELGEGASPAVALRAELDRLGLRCSVGEELAAVRRTLTHRELTLRAFACTIERESGSPGAELRWSVPEDLATAGVPTAVRRLLEQV
jgi:A/G-specific adenine glycosylase